VCPACARLHRSAHIPDWFHSAVLTLSPRSRGCCKPLLGSDAARHICHPRHLGHQVAPCDLLVWKSPHLDILPPAVCKPYSEMLVAPSNIVTVRSYQAVLCIGVSLIHCPDSNWMMTLQRSCTLILWTRSVTSHASQLAALYSAPTADAAHLSHMSTSISAPALPPV
jgi:hypothetical protein